MESLQFSFIVNVTDLSCNNETATSDDDDDDSDTDGDGIGNGDVDPDDTSICGTDGNSYPSTCHMLQTSNDVQVLHAGRCNASRCKGGQVSNCFIDITPFIDIDIKNNLLFANTCDMTLLNYVGLWY